MIIAIELIAIWFCFWLLRKVNHLSQVTLIVNWLFCMYLIEISEGIFVSNKKYIEVTPEPFSFLSYFFHIVALIPSVVLLTIHFLQTRSSAAGKLAVLLTGCAALTGWEYLLDAAGALHHTKEAAIFASIAYWYLLLVIMLAFNRLLQWKAKRV